MANDEFNPLKQSPDIYDILNMLRHMDNHLEAREYADKLNRHFHGPKVEPGSALKTKPTVGKTKPTKNVRVQMLKGRKIIRRIMGEKRFHLDAKAVLTKNDRYIKGQVINISKSGLFVNADRQVFKENEKIRVYIKPHGMQKAYHTIATVMRFNNDPRYPKGYGLKFIIPESSLSYPLLGGK